MAFKLFTKTAIIELLLNYSRKKTDENNYLLADNELNFELKRILNIASHVAMPPESEQEKIKFLAHIKNIRGLIASSAYIKGQIPSVDDDDMPENTAKSEITTLKSNGKFTELEGWQSELFLYMELFTLFRIFAEEKNKPNSDSAFLIDLQQEAWISINALHIVNTYQKITANPVDNSVYITFVGEFLASLCQESASMEFGEELCFPCGFKGHAIYLAIIFLKDKLLLRIDNLGPGCGNHGEQTTKIGGQTVVQRRPHLVSVVEFSNDIIQNSALVQYLAGVCFANFLDERKALAKIYDHPPFNLFESDVQLEHDFPFSNEQVTGHCVAANFLAGMKCRLGDKEYKKILEERMPSASVFRPVTSSTTEDIHRKIQAARSAQKFLAWSRATEMSEEGLTPALISKIQQFCAVQSKTEELQDDLELYLPLKGMETKHFIEDTTTLFDLNDAALDFVKNNKSVLLILAEAGSGKSFFGQMLIRDLSAKYQMNMRIPLFISLPSLRRDAGHKVVLSDTTLKEILNSHGFSDREVEILRLTQQFLIYIDSFDEINTRVNLWQQLKLDKWNAKIIFTCRPSYLAQDSNYKSFFVSFRGASPSLDKFQEYYIAPFINEQITLYISQYLKVKLHEIRIAIDSKKEFSDEWLTPDTYSRWIKSILGLEILVNNPFLLKITMDTLPYIVTEFKLKENNHGSYQITRTKLYDMFTQRWFIRHEDRQVSHGEAVSRTFQRDCMAFSIKLAQKMDDYNITHVTFDPESTIQNIFGYNNNSTKRNQEWDVFFSDEFIKQDKDDPKNLKYRQTIRHACPLRKVGVNQYGFMHASLLAHFLTKSIKQDIIPHQQNIPGEVRPSINK